MKTLHIKYLFLVIFLPFSSCETKNTSSESINSSLILDLEPQVEQPKILKQRTASIQEALNLSTPILLLKTKDPNLNKAQKIAIKNESFCKNLFDPKTNKALRNEIFNVYEARPHELQKELRNKKIFKVERYNFATNATHIAFVNINEEQVIKTSQLKGTQPDIPAHLKDLAIALAVNHPEVQKALGYKPDEKDALMSNTKTALNRTKCERSRHLCVAPTFTKGDKALWVIVDLTDHKVVGIRWTHTGKEQPKRTISEKRLKFDKIMECYCKEIREIKRNNWQLDYIITNSDGLRVSDVRYKNKNIINNAKVVDWHVSYSNTQGFGYSDAVGCPEFSQAAVVADSEPIIADLKNEQGTLVGFSLEQTFSTELWPMPCNYKYIQRYEFYNDGSFRPIIASLGRGCGNNGTYRPVFRFSFPNEKYTFSEYNDNTWNPWKQEAWTLQDENKSGTAQGYRYKIENTEGNGLFIEPNHGQFNDKGRGDFPYIYVTKWHADIDEGTTDLVTIGPCCNSDYQQGPEKFINKPGQSIINEPLVLWYVCQMKNDDRPGQEYCWAESYVEDGIYKTKTYPCYGGPKFVPIKK